MLDTLTTRACRLARFPPFVPCAHRCSGSYIVEHLLSGHPDAQKFTKVIATSRRPPNADWVKHDLPKGAMGNKLVWIEADLLNESVEQLAEKFAKHGVDQATHFYWGAYALAEGWGSQKELEVNEKMFANCLGATCKVATGLERCLLQLGAKWHVRSPFPVIPIRESDTPPNVPLAPFYNAQLEIAKKVT